MTRVQLQAPKIMIDRAAFDKLFEDSVDEYDLAENFGFFVEDYILFEDDSHDKYVTALRELPPMIRHLYLAFIVKISVEGDGFQSYFAHMEENDLMNETVAGLRLLQRDAAAEAYEEARNYPGFRQQEVRVSVMDEPSNRIHSKFFRAFGVDFWEDLGKYLHQNRKTALDYSC